MTADSSTGHQGLRERVRQLTAQGEALRAKAILAGLWRRAAEGEPELLSVLGRASERAA